jgi:hypothetical protein
MLRRLVPPCCFVVAAALWCGSADAQTTPELPAFLAGCWEEWDGDKLVQEQWMAPLGGMMLGSGRTLRGSRVVGWEHMLIEINAAGMHFVASPSGKSTTRFALLAHAAGSVVFGNPSHGFPTQVRYWLLAPDALAAQISGVVNGNARSIDFRYRRVACP